MGKKKAVVLLSGGMDSVTLLYHALDKGFEVLPISFAYGSKHNVKERAAAQVVCNNLGVQLWTHNINTTVHYWDDKTQLILGGPLLKSDLLLSGGEIPEGHYEEDSMKATVVPFRNGIMLSLAVGFAESYEADTIILGNHAGDHAVYPDCRAAFITAFAQTAWHGTYNHIHIESPFVTWSKTEVVAWGMKNKVPYENTWTCYKGGDRPCLKCGTCVERTEAFLDVFGGDPLLTEQEWGEAIGIYVKICDERDAG